MNRKKVIEHFFSFTSESQKSVIQKNQSINNINYINKKHTYEGLFIRINNKEKFFKMEMDAFIDRTETQSVCFPVRKERQSDGRESLRVVGAKSIRGGMTFYAKSSKMTAHEPKFLSYTHKYI